MTGKIEIKTLGRVTIFHNGQPIPPFRTVKAQALLLYLLEERTAAHTRDHLMTLLWPRLPEKSARDNLRQTLYQLRKSLPVPLIESTRQTVRIDPTQAFTLDIATIADLGDDSERLADAVQKLSETFAADFSLPDSNPFEAWLRVIREQYHRQFGRLSDQLITVRLAQNRPQDAIQLADQWIERDPNSEDAYRHLMIAYHAAEKRVEALKAYKRCEEMMQSEWGIAPSAATQAVHNTLRDTPAPNPQHPTPRLQIQTLPPFIAGVPITNPQQFFGRKRELKRIGRWLNYRPMTHIAIVGQRRSGKTSLMHHLSHVVSGMHWVWVDFQDPRMRSLDYLLPYLLTESGIAVTEPPTLPQFIELLLAHTWERPTIIIMDELGAGLAADELTQSFWWMLRSLVNSPQTAQLAFVVAAYQNPITVAEAQGKTSPFFNVFSTVQLGRFTEAEAHDLITSGGDSFTAEDTAWILETSDRWPFLLQICCQERLYAAETSETDNEWQTAACERIEPYRYLLTS